VYPALQRQAVIPTLKVGEIEFAAQFKHVPKAAYVPTVHCTHGPPLGPLHKALQTQSVMALLAAREIEFDGQREQGAGPDTVL